MSNSIIIFALLVYLVQSIGGFLLIHLIWDVRELKALVLKIFLGIGMGAGVTSLLFFLWVWFLLPVQIFVYFEAILLITLAFLVWRKERSQSRPKPVLNSSEIQKRTIVWAVLALTAVSFSVVSFWLYASVIPHGFYDAWATWNAGARFIYGIGSGWIQLLSQDYWGHPDYPPLVAFNIANGWLLLGGMTTRVPVVFSLLFMFGLVGLVFSALTLTRNFEQGALAAIVLSSLPVLPALGSFQYADIQLSYFFLATGILLYLYTLRTDSRILVLAGVFAGFSGWTKNEGQMFVVFSILVCLLLCINERKNLFKYYLVGLLIPVIAILVFKSVTVPSDLFIDKAKSFQQLFDLSRYQLVFNKLGEQFGSFGFWPVSFFALLLFYVFLVWRKPPGDLGKRWIPLILFLLQFGGYYMIYIITPRDLSWHLDTSLARLIFQILPLMIFWLFGILRSPADIFEEKLVAKSPN